MIEFKVGNLLETDVEALVNTVNTDGVMGKGIALQFKRAFPEMFKAYKKACDSGELSLGKLHLYEPGTIFNPRFIINFPTKAHWRSKSRLTDIETGLAALAEIIQSRNIRSIAIPPLGCGLGGLKWEHVRPLIEKYLGNLPNVRVSVFPPQNAPAAESMIDRTARPEMTLSRAKVLHVLNSYLALGYELTFIEVQKLLYFLQVAGEPLQLRFEKQKYGPYADNLRHVLQKFEGHFTIGFGDGKNQPTTPIRLIQEAVQEAEAFLSKNHTNQLESEQRLNRVTDLIEGFESPYGMELLATTHWVVTHEQQGKNAPEEAILAVHDWSERKRKLMKPDHIQIAWKRLSEQNWF